MLFSQSRHALPALLLLSLLLPMSSHAASGKYVLGWIEQINLLSEDRVFDAKLDSGAKTSSIDAHQIQEFSRDEENWVSFVVPGRDGADDIKLEREIYRQAKIIQQDGEQGDVRNVVLLNICIAGEVHKAQFTLANREAFDEQFLIGRRLLKDLAYIDASEKFLSEPTCSGG